MPNSLTDAINCGDSKKVYILLTDLPARTCEAFKFFSRSKYSHASIALGDSGSEYFSFTGKGFGVEHPIKKHTGPVNAIPCALYSVDVSEEVIERIENKAKYFLLHKYFYKYNRLGLVLSIIGIHFKRQQHYFCSQFVAESLQECGVIGAKRHSTKYYPDHFAKEKNFTLCYEGNIGGLMQELKGIPCDNIFQEIKREHMYRRACKKAAGGVKRVDRFVAAMLANI